MHNPYKILFAPLDWGLGHATRCIPLIKECLLLQHEVLIAGDRQTNALLCNEFPNLTYLELKGYRIQYAKKKWKLPFVILSQLPKIISTIRHEYNWLQGIIDQHKIDIVFSDNRYGLYSGKALSYIICHQLQIQIPQSAYLQKMANQLHGFYINKFKACLVPDYEEDKMSGLLSKNKHIKHILYLGNLSRFQAQKGTAFRYDLLILLSGPEPQRSILEQKLLIELQHTSYSTLIVRGMPEGNEAYPQIQHVKMANHLSGEDLQRAILDSKIIICRSGYSTVMDLIKLNKNAVLIPTPGQTEQEYLAKYLRGKNWFLSCEQHQLSLNKVIDLYGHTEFTSFPEWDLELYKQVMNKLLDCHDF